MDRALCQALCLLDNVFTSRPFGDVDISLERHLDQAKTVLDIRRLGCWGLGRAGNNAALLRDFLGCRRFVLCRVCKDFSLAPVRVA